MSYTNEEYFEMLLLYGKCDRNAAATVREYEARFPDRRQPDQHVILRLAHRARTTGHFIPGRTGAGGVARHGRMINMEEAILESIDEDPTRSVRALARLTHVSKTTTHRILKENLFHPFHYTQVQQLNENDYPMRLQFCRWLLRKNEENYNFTRNILFTDESIFSHEGIYNAHNWHEWAVENPHIIRVRGFQQRFSINMWAGILGDRLVGPFILPQRLNGDNYANFLSQHLPELLENIPLNIRREMWFQHDGAPPHYSLLARQVLNDLYPNRCIGRGFRIWWPPRSPDLNPLDFFLWAYLKEYVYRQPVATIEELEDRLREAIATVTPQMLENMQMNLLRRAAMCVQMGGGHFEQYL